MLSYSQLCWSFFLSLQLTLSIRVEVFSKVC